MMSTKRTTSPTHHATAPKEAATDIETATQTANQAATQELPPTATQALPPTATTPDRNILKRGFDSGSKRLKKIGSALNPVKLLSPRKKKGSKKSVAQAAKKSSATITTSLVQKEASTKTLSTNGGRAVMVTPSHKVTTESTTTLVAPPRSPSGPSSLSEAPREDAGRVSGASSTVGMNGSYLIKTITKMEEEETNGKGIPRTVLTASTGPPLGDDDSYTDPDETYTPAPVDIAVKKHGMCDDVCGDAFAVAHFLPRCVFM
jgi:hypothetical protein